MNATRPNRRRTVVIILALVSTVAALGLAAAWLYLPTLASRQLPVDDIRQLGFAGFSGRINSIGPTRVLAGPFAFGEPADPAVFIGNLEINYTPGGLRRRTLGRILASDVVLNAELGPDGIRLPGLDPTALTAAHEPSGDGASTTGTAGGTLAGATFERLMIRSGQLNLRWGERLLRVPFAMELVPDGDGMQRVDAQLQLALRDQPLTLAATVDLGRRSAQIKIDGPQVALEAFGDLIPPDTGISASGSARITAGADLSFSPFSIAGIHLDLYWPRGRLQIGELAIAPVGAAAPASVSIAAESLDAVDVSAAGFGLPLTVPIAIDTIAARVTRDAAGYRLAGTSTVALPATTLGPAIPGTLKKDIRLALQIAATLNQDGEWQVEMDNAPSTPARPQLELAMDESSLSADFTRFSIDANGRGGAGKVTWTAKLDAMRGRSGGEPAVAFVVAPVSAEGELTFATDDTGLTYHGGATVRTADLSGDGAGAEGRFRDLSAKLHIRRSKTGKPGVSGRIQGKNGRAGYPTEGIVLSGIEFDLPLGLGSAPENARGRFSIGQIEKAKQVVGSLQGSVRWQPDGYRLDGTLSSDRLPGLTATFDGSLPTEANRLGDGTLTIALPAWRVPEALDLSAFSPAATGLRLGGSVDGRATLSRVNGHLTGDMTVAFREGSLTVAEKNISVAGIDVTLAFPELPRIRSAPAQKLRFGQATMGGIVVNDGSIDFQVESADTFFVEKGCMTWCGGVIDAGSLRLTAGREDYTLNLYCQRLGLSGILEQLGAVNARGSGSVNGRIPISYRDGKLHVDDGFLFSTPGEGGKLQLTGTEILTRGIPPDTPQFTQVDLAREALMDYAYDWAKLGLTSEGETFVLRLQFDGKPVRPLPFVYKKEIGSFVRVEAGGAGSRFQGIALDVNLRLPLNQLLQYKDIVNMIN